MKTVASFEIEYFQYLNADSEVVAELPEFCRNAENLISFYKGMVLTRVFDQKAVALQRTGRMGTYASSEGQEACMIGLGKAMHKEDVLFPTYREHGVYLTRGVTMTEIFTYWGGNESGMNFSQDSEDFPVCIPIATQIPHATGAAYAFKYRRQARVAVAVCGDGATSKGDFYEGLNAAGVWKLPCVFAVVNNQWAISLPRARQTACDTMAQKAIAAGIPGEQVDGNDVIAIYHRFECALDKARSGGGPTLIEPLTYRIRDHTTADDASRYRTEQEVEQQRKLDPIARLKKYLVNQKEWSEDEDRHLIEEVEAKVDAATEEYLAAPPRPAHTMFDCLYESLPQAYQHQRQQLIGTEESGHE